VSQNGVPSTMDLTERREAERKIAQARRDARRDYVAQSEIAANEDLAYRKTKAIKLVEYRVKEPAGIALVLAEADAAEHKHRRKIAESLAKAALLKIEETERDSVTTRDIHATSQKIDGLSA
jgi:hypothetical protein